MYMKGSQPEAIVSSVSRFEIVVNGQVCSLLHKEIHFRIDVLWYTACKGMY